jgi:hypothetical protein
MRRALPIQVPQTPSTFFRPHYFDLGTAEARACHHLVFEARDLLLEQDKSILGFNVGINSGKVAGQR